jgi:hypothetical protein
MRATSRARLRVRVYPLDHKRRFSNGRPPRVRASVPPLRACCPAENAIGLRRSSSGCCFRVTPQCWDIDRIARPGRWRLRRRRPTQSTRLAIRSTTAPRPTSDSKRAREWPAALIKLSLTSRIRLKPDPTDSNDGNAADGDAVGRVLLFRPASSRVRKDPACVRGHFGAVPSSWKISSSERVIDQLG